MSTDQFGKTRILDWNKFVEVAKIDTSKIGNTFEYQNAYSSYVDGIITLDTQMQNLIKQNYDNAFSSITEWKPVNLAKLS